MNFSSPFLAEALVICLHCIRSAKHNAPSVSSATVVIGVLKNNKVSRCVERSLIACTSYEVPGSFLFGQ